MISKEDRIDFGRDYNLNVNPKTKIDYLYLTSAAYSYCIDEEIGLPSDEDIDIYKEWIKRNEDKSLILSMISLYKDVVEKLDKLEIKLSDTHIQNWIVKNANSIDLACNYRNNLSVVAKELIKLCQYN
jgi:hypothetical protein